MNSPLGPAPHSVRLITISIMAILMALVVLVWQTTVAAVAPRTVSDDGLWLKIAESDFQTQGERWIVPEQYLTVALDLADLQMVLAEETAVINLPLPDGTFSRFAVTETAVMHPELAARFPEIKTYAGTGLDDTSATVRLDVTPAGFHGMILSAGDTVYIDPYSRQDTEHYIIYYRQDLANPHEDFVQHQPLGDAAEIAALVEAMAAEGGNLPSGDELRTYRLVVAATGEYTQYHGGTVPAGMAAIVTAVNRVVGIYIRDTAVNMQLVANNDQVVYTDPNTDPYTNNNGGVMLGQNQTNLDAVIGNDNYDIGHVFSTGGGGIASLGVPCRTGSKARGVTGLSNPIGDPFYVDYVAHEMGHQYGANHTFNGNAGSCAGNRNGSTAYEPGSGTTIMAYAGICGDQDIQPNSDDHFHTGSIDEIRAYTVVGLGNSCPVITDTINLPPTVNAGSDYIIPVDTPFTLVGSATDPNGDSLTYNWEQFDVGPAGHPDSPTGNAPLFRSFSSVPTTTRTFPQLSDLVNNVHTIGEILPSYSRNMKFHLTVRDNRVEAGGVNMDEMDVAVAESAGPFLVTAPDTAITWNTGYVETVTWDVSNTDQAPVNCAEVDIRLSLDGGYTYPVLIEANRPNDGSESIIVPNAPTTQARVKVQCSDNIFFDISDADFSIVPGPPDFTLSAEPESLSICPPADAIYEVTVGSALGYTQSVSLSSVGQPDPPNSVSFSSNNMAAPYTSTMTVETTDALGGTYAIDIVGMGPTSTHTVTVQLNLCAPEIAIEPTGLSSTQPPDTVVTHTLTISNVGTGQLDWDIFEQNESTFLDTVTVATYPETAETAATLTPIMQALLQDKEPVQNLQPQGATACIGGMADSYPCSNIDLLSFLPLGSIGGGSGNDIWGWTGCNGREFALMGRTTGTSFVEITDPVNPVYLGNLPPHTSSSIWRDIKTYADYAFIVSEASGHGMQIFDLSQLCNVASPPVTFAETMHYNGFGNAHNIVINEDSGYAYGVGTATCAGGLHMVNIQNPLSPTNVGCFSTDGYTHDAQCVNYQGPDTEHQGQEICFNSNTDTLTIVDVTDKAAPAQLSRTGYTGSGYTHQGWLTGDQAYFLLDDEADETGFGHNTRTYIWDLADLDDPMLIGNYTASTAAIDHNLYIKGDYAFQSNYRAGLRILDINDIANANLFEEAYFDIYPSSDSANFNGSWSNYPYFDSGVVVVSGIEQGLFVLRPTTLPTTACASPSDIPWLTVSPASGATAENDSTPINVTFDATGLTSGEYTASLCITSNALNTPEIEVPVTLTINQAPVAAADTYTTTQEMALIVAAPGVLANDSDDDGNSLTAVLDATPSNGILTFNADGSFIYTPTVGFDGSDTFTYHADDGVNNSNIATVTINVLNTAPVAVTDTYTIDQDAVLSVSAPGVLGNDSDDDNDSLTAVLDTTPDNGLLTFNTDGSFIYTPTVGFVGMDSFTYHANDGIDDSNIVTVSISVGDQANIKLFLPFIINDE